MFFLRGVAGRDSGEFFLMNFELLRNDQTIHTYIIWHGSKMNPFIYRKRIFCVMLALFV